MSQICTEGTISALPIRVPSYRKSTKKSYTLILLNKKPRCAPVVCHSSQACSNTPLATRTGRRSSVGWYLKHTPMLLPLYRCFPQTVGGHLLRPALPRRQDFGCKLTHCRDETPTGISWCFLLFPTLCSSRYPLTKLIRSIVLEAVSSRSRQAIVKLNGHLRRTMLEGVSCGQ